MTYFIASSFDHRLHVILFQNAIHEAGCIELLVAALKRHAAHSSVAEQACLALHNLAIGNTTNQVIHICNGCTTDALPLYHARRMLFLSPWQLLPPSLFQVQ